MSGSTLLLIVKSLIPLAREIIFKDKDLKAFLLSNKVGSILFGCLVFLFVAFLYVAEIADSSSHEIEKLKFAGGYDAANIIDLKGQIVSLKSDKEVLMQQLRGGGVPPAILPDPPDAHLPASTNTKRASKNKDKPTNDGLKSYFDERLRALDSR